MTREEIIYMVGRKYQHLSPLLNERTRRCWAATEAHALGRGGLAIVCKAIGIDHKTVQAGLREINDEGEHLTPDRIRKSGAGRKKLVSVDTGLANALDALIAPTERGDPESSLRWTLMSTPKLAKELTAHGHPISQRSVCTLLYEQHYSLQANRKTEEGADHPDRDAQFRFINESVKSAQTKNQPVISVDTKKKELIGNFKNSGQEWRKKGNPRHVNMHDFADPALGKAIPHGVYDLSQNEGWVTVGIDHDTASFAVASIRRWWMHMGRKRYPNAHELLITADCGGSNAHRSRLWKRELQKFSDEMKLTVHVRHFPPGTSKWNKIEHRLFSFISRNWRGKPLLSRAIIVSLIAGTKNKAGLTVKAYLDEHHYETGKTVSDAEIALLNLIRESFHGEWNYRVEPRKEKGNYFY